MKKGLLLLIVSLTSMVVLAQSSSLSKSDWKLIGVAKYVTQHYWRGLGEGPIFGKAPAFEPSVTITNGKFSAGVASGASFDNVYKCMIPWVSFSPVKGLKVSLSDIFSAGTNFWDTDIFDFDLHSSKHFVDLSIDYKTDFNLGIKLATLVAGADRKPGEPDKRNFTSYCELNYVYTWERWSAAAAIGVTPWEGLYSRDKAGVNNMEATLKYKLPVYGKASMPVWIRAGYNSLANYFQFLAGASIVIPYDFSSY